MLTEERYDRIMEHLAKKDRATVPELLELLNVSESTLRRDLMSLEAQGRCRRIRGGVSASPPQASLDSLLEKRRAEFSKEKQEIGRKAAALVEDGDVIYLDAGTTTETMISYLEGKEIRVVTNSINHASLLAALGLPVTLVGGEFKNLTNALVGEETLLFLEKYRFSKGFFGTNAIGINGELLTPDIREAAVKGKAMSHSRQAYVLADSSKFSRVSAICFGTLQDAVLVSENNASIPEDFQGLSLYASSDNKNQKENFS